MVEQYLNYAKAILTQGTFKGGSKGSGIISLFGYQNSYDLTKGFPLVTTKQMPAKSKSMFTELLWFLKGDTNIEYLEKNKSPVWRSDTFQHNLNKLVKEGIYPSGLVKYSPEWHEALNDYGERVGSDYDFAQKFGDAGPIYPKQWRRWSKFSQVKGGDKQLYIKGDNGEFMPIKGKAYQEKEIDQVQNMINGLKKKPTGKKHILTGWNVSDIKDMSLPPCHLLFQATANGHGELEMQLYQRSCDSFLGVPFNIAQYAALTQIIAKEANMVPKKFVHTFGDAHFYTAIGDRTKWYEENFEKFQNKVRNAVNIENRTGDKGEYLEIIDWINNNAPKDGIIEKYDHVTGILEQLSNDSFEKCTLEIANKSFDQLELEDFEIKNYKSHKKITRSMCV